MVRAIAPALLLALGLLPGPSSAQSLAAYPLKGLSAFHVSVEGIYGNSCHLDIDALKSRLSSVLANDEMKIDEDPGSSIVYLNVLPSDRCDAARVDLEVREFATVDQTKVREILTLWSKGWLLPGSAGLVERVNDAVDRLGRRLAGDWASMNPR